MKTDTTFYTIEEFAQLLRVHDNTIRAAVREGKITAFKIGQQYRIPESELEKLKYKPEK